MNLQDIYDKLRENLIEKKKLKHDSCLVSLAFGVKSNVRNHLIKDSAVNENSISPSEKLK